MAEALAHRGPDGQGTVVGERVAFAVRRLSLVDLPGGRQPLTDESGGVLLGCNGEIHNHHALREELERAGHAFTTRTDVEVIVHLYEEHGIDLLERIDGQFAFVLHDTRNGVTYLARDRYGICPLFFTEVGDQVIFASEISGLLAHPAVGVRIDLTGLDQVMTLPGLVSPRTMLDGVKSVPPGHYCTVVDGRVRATVYWDMVYPEEPASYPELTRQDAAELLLVTLAESVEQCLAADVPVGAYLSGGLDSSLVAALAVAVRGEPLEATFSVGYRDMTYDESKYVELMAPAVSRKHHQLRLDTSDLVELLPSVIAHTGCPLRESYNAASMALAGMVSEAGMRAVVGGEGADELFGGYVGYRLDQLRDGSGWGVRPTPEERRLRTLAWGDGDLRYEHDLTKLRARSEALYTAEVREAIGAPEESFASVVNSSRVVGRHRLHQRSYLDLKLRLADHLLGDHGDRMAMARSVEVRYPFLTRRIADLVAWLPPELMLRGMEEKAVVRDAAGGLVPAPILRREKFAWAAPGTVDLLRTHQLRPAARDLVDYLLSPSKIQSDAIFDVTAVERLRSQQAAGPKYTPNGEPDLLMVVMTMGLFMDHVEHLKWI
jgi:asparagine synthase (glutamine-hydrolysing)